MNRVKKSLLIFSIPFLAASISPKELIVHEGYLSIQNPTQAPLIFQYVGADQKCVLVPETKPIRLNPGQGIFFPVRFSEPCEARLQFRIVKIEQALKTVELLPNFISKGRVQRALRQQKHPTRVL